MTTTRPSASFRTALAALMLSVSAGSVQALERVDIRIEGPIDTEERETLQNRVSGASLSQKALDEEITDGQEIMASARSDYARILGVLYEEGYYGPSVSIMVDRREAAETSPFSAPQDVQIVQIIVQTGPRFRFGQTDIDPRAPDSVQPLATGFEVGKRARANVIGTAARTAVNEWKDLGYAKADVDTQDITADHNARRLNVDIGLNTGPRLRFGDVTIDGNSKIREERLRQILGWPRGERYSPDELQRSVTRLRRSGVFSTVNVRESDTPNPDGTLDYNLTLIENKPRRIGFGAEYSTLDGLLVNGFWLHRNVFGGAERFRIDGEIKDIGEAIDNPTTGSGVDYRLSARLTRPAAFGPDRDLFLYGNLEHNDEPDYVESLGSLGVGITRYFNEDLYAEIAIGLRYSHVEDDLGERDFTHLVLPSRVEWDERDDPGDAAEGYYLNVRATPFISTGESETGMQAYIDGRTYWGFGEETDTVLAARLQLGSVLGSSIKGTPPNYLFYSGGGNTVRGFEYESLGVEADGAHTGGRSFIGLSTEVRRKVTNAIGVVGFVDTGFVGPDSFYTEDGSWQTGVGLGIRYDTPIGPLRVDLATPVQSEDKDAFSAVELYIGVGQAF
ncbi:autotransporter assembly complex protein TamA [Qingshengfaniella alkalisoli]|uniref:Outer membrane protein assembly factor n=1 Tax=Qingshengfaniella alkalisoli TaxID=2599296 RepID=A0A5B8I8M0_9RHOB|nr:autotransporter assembly complex family protein [Qingshengfaniella alkalisoli]QDY69056.1 outer membrane protein assembly factor [Qingshengfaniella alkalisoli]